MHFRQWRYYFWFILVRGYVVLAIMVLVVQIVAISGAPMALG
jgi:hypothetical protein